MGRQNFTISILLSLLVIQQVYIHFQLYFDSSDTYHHEAIVLQDELGRERLRHQVTWNHLVRFRKYISHLMPEVSLCLEERKQRRQGKEKKRKRGRNLASLSDGETASLFDLFEKGQTYLREKNYIAAAQIFERLVSGVMGQDLEIESRYLLVESYFLMGDFVKSLVAIEALVDLYPRHKFTGYSLMRMAEIYKGQGRGEEAIGIYTTILNEFEDGDLAIGARNAMAL